MTQSALLVEVPAAELAVSGPRRELDPAAALGVPAHLTVLFPFVLPAAIDDQVLARVTAVADTVRPFDLALSRTAWFGDDVLWLAPDDPGPLRRLTDQMWAAFPEHPPYGGVFDDVVPHLTVGQAGSHAAPDALRTVEPGVAGRLPVRQRVDSLSLWVGGTRPGSWRRSREFPFDG